MTYSQHPGSYRRLHKRTASAALVEFAFVAPVLFLFILALFEFGRAFMVCELLTESARVGCRRAIIEGASSAQIQQTVTNYLTSVGITSEAVGISINDAALNSMEAANQPAKSEMTVQVTVPVNTVSWVPNPLFVKSGALSGQFTMRRE